MPEISDSDFLTRYENRGILKITGAKSSDHEHGEANYIQSLRIPVSDLEISRAQTRDGLILPQSFYTADGKPVGFPSRATRILSINRIRSTRLRKLSK